MRLRRKELALHVCIAAMPLLFLVVLAWQRLAPTGVRVVVADTREPSPYIHRLQPESRAPENDGDGVTIVDEPVYFSAQVPDGQWQEVTVTLDYRNRGQPVIELGALTDIFSQSYDLRPLENTILDALDWPSLREGSRVVYAKDGLQAETIDAALAAADRTHVALYRADVVLPYRDPSYRSLSTGQIIDTALRGYHKYATYLGEGEVFSAAYTFHDTNDVVGPDNGVVRVWNEQGEVVLEQVFVDDGTTDDGGSVSAAQTMRVQGGDWPAGVYEVELVGTSDIVWQRLSLAQRYAAFLYRIVLADDAGATSFVTNATHLVFEPQSAVAPTSVTFAGEAVGLAGAGQKTSVNRTGDDVATGAVASGDVLITGDGMFALTPESFFSPYVAQLTAATDFAAQGVTTIVAGYTPPTVLDDGWHRAEATFALVPITQSDRVLKFVVSAPGIADRQATVDVRRVALTFRKTPMTLTGVFSAVLGKLTRIL